MLHSRLGEKGFIIPAILACVLLVLLSLSSLAPLLYRERLRAGIRIAHVRDRLAAHTGAGAELQRITSDLQSASPRLFSVSNRTSFGTLQTLIAKTKMQSDAFSQPIWTKIEKLSFKNADPCASWATLASSTSVWAAGASCRQLSTAAVDNIFLRGNLRSDSTVTIDLSPEPEHIFAIAGEVQVSQELRIQNSTAARVTLIAIGDIRLQRILSDADQPLELSLLSVAGDIVIKELPPSFDLCEAEPTGGPRFAVQSPKTITLGARPPSEGGKLGCRLSLPQAIRAPYSLLGSSFSHPRE